MPLIHVAVGVPPCQVDDFPATVGEGKGARPFQRSCKGALHLRPASTKTVTEDELHHLQTKKKYQKLAARISVVQVVKKAAKPAPPAAKPAKMPPPAKPADGKK